MTTLPGYEGEPSTVDIRSVKGKPTRTFEVRLSVGGGELTPRPKHQKLGSDDGQEHDARAAQRAGVPPPMGGVLPGRGDVRVDRDPRAGKDGDETAPDDVPNGSAAAQVGAGRFRAVFDDDRVGDRHGGGVSEDEESGEKEQHDRDHDVDSWVPTARCRKRTGLLDHLIFT